jgi:CheY-like chemotaxis protein
MSSYDLERLSVLIVDDSAFGRALIGRVLRSLGIRQITAAADGSEAIHLLKTIATNPQKIGVQRFDMILCDWVMAPVDGPMLLKWLRRHKDSPDRFMPFVMVSAQAEEERVREARDLGANEFLAKPFSINTIANKLLQLVDRPRPFVYTRSYFGPDRRRAQQPITFANRRHATKETIALLHTPKLPAVFPDHIVAYYLRASTRLKDIVAGLGVDQKEPGQLQDGVLEAAELELTSMESDYADWVRGTVDKLQKTYAALREQPKNHWKYFRVINDLAHDLRGEGQTFGYPLVTDFGKSLFEYTKMNVQPDERFLDLLHAHIEAIQVIIREKIKGQGGEIGQTIVATLEAAKRKWEQQTVG